MQAQFTEKYSLTKEKVPHLAQNRNLDDYCPRVQLKKLIDSCETPNLSFQQIPNSDSSTTYPPVDANDTKNKIMTRLMISSKSILVRICKMQYRLCSIYV